MKDDTLESRILSGLCRSQEVRALYLDKIDRTDFASKGYDKIFDAIVRCAQSDIAVNRESLKSQFTGDVLMQTMVVFCFDTTLPEVTTEAFIAFKQQAKLNKLDRMATHITRRIKQGNADSSLLMEEVRQMVDAADGGGDTSMVEVSDAEQTVNATLDLIDLWAKGGTPYRTFLPEIDENLFLSQLLGYNVIAGESGAGKTAFMMNIAKANAEKHGKPSVIFSLEMRKELLCLRMAMSDPRLHGLEFSEEQLKDPKKRSDIQYAVDRLRKLPIVIVDNVYNIYHINRIARKLSKSMGATMMMLDYLQLADTHPADQDVVRVSKVSAELKKMTAGDHAKGLPGMTVIALSQYSESASTSGTGQWSNQNGTNGKSAIKSLRWSRQIRMDADLVGHLTATSDPSRPIVDVRFFCEKQRNYRDGWYVDMQFHKSTQSFTTNTINRTRVASSTPVEL